MKNKLFVIGDSFCRDSFYVEPRINEKKSFWAEELSNKLETELICDGEPSRDVQTIIDNWIKIIKIIKSTDYLIICIPFFKRLRLPLSDKNYSEVSFGDEKYVNRFVGLSSFNNIDNELEIFGNQYEWKYFENQLKTQELINGSNASQLNFIEVIECLYDLTNGKKFVFSWDIMDKKSYIIEDKQSLTEKIGIWETHRDIFYNTDGAYGLKDDMHWSYNMNNLFAEYMYEKFIK